MHGTQTNRTNLPTYYLPTYVAVAGSSTYVTSWNSLGRALSNSAAPTNLLLSQNRAWCQQSLAPDSSRSACKTKSCFFVLGLWLLVAWLMAWLMAWRGLAYGLGGLAYGLDRGQEDMHLE